MAWVRVFLTAAWYHMRGHFSRPMDAAFAVLGTLINNVVFFFGIYTLFFGAGDGMNPDGYLGLTAIVLLASGSINLFCANFFLLGRLIEQGRLEEYMTVPIHPLAYLAISRIDVSFLGEVLQGSVLCGVITYRSGLLVGFQTLALAFSSSVAFASVSIFAGALSFFSRKSGALSELVNEATFTLSIFPSGKIMTGRLSFFKYVTPALLTSIWPVWILESRDTLSTFAAVLASVGFLALSIVFFDHARSFYLPGARVAPRS